MPSHDYHEGQPGYSPDQILHDGCGECARRAGNLQEVFARMDAMQFTLAWKRAAEFQRGRLDDVSAAEAPFLRNLWCVIAKLRELRPETVLKLMVL